MIANEKVYCIYSDSYFEYNETNPEHILPLSVGGCNTFCIRVEKSINSKLGSAIDGKFANDFFIATIRKAKRYYGHGRAPFKVTWNKSTLEDGKPIIVTLSDGGINVFDPVKKKAYTDEEIEGVTLKSKFTMDLHLASLFVAKCALAAGYFVYRDIFSQYADHNSLRKYISYGLDRTKKEEIVNLPLRIVDRFSKIEDKDIGLKGVFENICKGLNDSCIIFMLCESTIIASVGIGGTYIGSITFDAQTEHFPNEDRYRLGYVACVQNKVLTSGSFYDAVAALKTIMDTSK